MTRTGTAMFSMLTVSMLTLTSACSSALTLSGELDGEPVPAGFSGAMAQLDFSGQEFAFGVWSTLSDTCGLSGRLLDGISDTTADGDATIDTIEEFFDEVPGDFWLMTTSFADGSDGNLDDEADFDELNVAGFLCHFTSGPDLSNSPDSSCAAINTGTSRATLRLVDDNSLSFSGEIELVQQERNGGTSKAGTLTGQGVAGVCPTLTDALDRFFVDCNSGFNEGCQAAQTAFIGSHTIQR